MWGIYFLANDTVIELAVAFLNSCRIHNEHIPLCLIPFDDNHQEILKLRKSYRFDVFTDYDVLHKCDAISRHFHSRNEGQYRKMAISHGPFDRFIYIDIDSVCLAPLDFVFHLLDDVDILTAHSNTHDARKYVWRDSIFAANALSTAQIEFAANTGFLATSRRTCLLERAEQSLSAAMKIKEHMELNCHEQPFVNYFTGVL